MAYVVDKDPSANLGMANEEVKHVLLCGIVDGDSMQNGPKLV